MTGCRQRMEVSAPIGSWQAAGQGTNQVAALAHLDFNKDWKRKKNGSGGEAGWLVIMINHLKVALFITDAYIDIWIWLYCWPNVLCSGTSNWKTVMWLWLLTESERFVHRCWQTMWLCFKDAPSWHECQLVSLKWARLRVLVALSSAWTVVCAAIFLHGATGARFASLSIAPAEQTL